MRGFAVGLAAVTVLRMFVAALVPLAPDEAYYWVWSQALALGYLDHPPMVALWIKAGTLLVGQTPLGVRLLGPLAAALASWLLFDAARCLFPRSGAGVIAVTLLNASLFLGVGTVIMTPDSPLLFFWTMGLWAAARIAVGGSGFWWLVAGLSGGLALDSKYTGLFLWIGIGLWVLLVPSVRWWLTRWHPWVAGAIGLALFAPVLIWNRDHQWASFVRQGGRVQDWRPDRAVGFLAELVGGQIGLATPIVWYLCMAGLVAASRAVWRRRDPAWSLLLSLSLPPVLVFVQHAFGGRVQGNWPVVIYPALAIASAGAGVRRRWWISAGAVGFAITLLAYGQASRGLLPLPLQLDPIASRLAGWDNFAGQVEAARRLADASFVVAEGYAETSELTWLLPEGTTVAAMGARWRLFDLPLVTLQGQVGILVRGERDSDPPDPVMWERADRFGTADRPGSGARGYVLYRVVPQAGGQAAALPRP